MGRLAQPSLFGEGPVGLAASELADNRLRQSLEPLLASVAGGWAPVLRAWQGSPAGRQLCAWLAERLVAGAVIYPADPFRALRLTPLSAVRLVILGQDPYHGPGQAEGLAFSVPAGCKLPPSLRNIFQELSRDLGCEVPPHGHLGGWARRGVLLLNTCLTVEAGLPASHAGHGWESLTDAVISAAAAQPGPVMFLLWGAHAQAKRGLIDTASQGRALVLQANHPSPLSARRPPRPFIGCGHFGQIRQVLGLDWLVSEA